jgi:inhibitor of cysteine peptidase
MPADRREQYRRRSPLLSLGRSMPAPARLSTLGDSLFSRRVARVDEDCKDRSMSNITLTAADNGGTIEVPQGTEVLIRLEENPTTGYRWAVDQNDDAAPVPQASDFSSTPGGAAGAGGTRTFTFTAEQPGTVHLRFKLWREWEGDSSVIDRFGVDIQVRG